jgi:hypothetical protein
MEIKHVTIIGGGSSGWMAAATLAKLCRHLKITIVESKNYATIGVGESTLGQINRWFNMLGITDEMWMKDCQATYKNSIRFTNFRDNDGTYFEYPFGGFDLEDKHNGLNSWSELSCLYPESFPPDSFAEFYNTSNTLLAKHNRQTKNKQSRLKHFDFNYDTAYHMDATAFGQWLKNNIALKHGVELIHNEIEKQKTEQIAVVQQLTNTLTEKEKGLSYLRTPQSVCEQYLDYERRLPTLVNKKRREVEREMKKIQDTHKYLLDDLSLLNAYFSLKTKQQKETKMLSDMELFIAHQTQLVCDVLRQNDFITMRNLLSQTYELTLVGKLAANIAEIHPLVIVELITEWNQMEYFNVFQMIGLLSCFVDIKVPEEKRAIEPKTKDTFLFYRIGELQRKIAKYQDIELQRQMYTGISYHDMIAFDIVDEMMEWAEKCNDEQSCKSFLQNKILLNKSISVGDFTKACLKISAIAKEWMSVGEQMGYTEWIHKCSQIDGFLLKYIATTQSLYV